MSIKDVLIFTGIFGAIFFIGIFFMTGGPIATKIMIGFNDWYFGNEKLITLIIKVVVITMIALFIYFIYIQFKT